MQEKREQFVEPEIIKHQEKLADVTLQLGYTDLSDDTGAAPTSSNFGTRLTRRCVAQSYSARGSVESDEGRETLHQRR
jgi:hypothetical protein